MGTCCYAGSSIATCKKRELAEKTSSCNRLKEPECLRAIAHQHVLGLLVMVEHHLVGLAPDAGLLIAAERRMRRIEVEAVDPNPTRLDAAAHAVGAVDVARPCGCAEAIERVVGDGERL